MDSKQIVYLIIGILVSGGAGFGASYIILNPQLNEILASYNNLEEQYEILTQEYETLSYVRERHEELSEQYQKLINEYNSLKIDFIKLNTEYNQLQLSYEDLLNEYEFLVAALPLSPEPLSAETVQREYYWPFKDRYWNLSLSIPESLYEYYIGKDRSPTIDYSVYVTHPYDDEYINTIIKKFNFIASEEGLTEAEKINLVISFIQSLPYIPDEVTTPFDEYPRYPLETLVDNGGDCEDTSILAASLLKAMKFDVILIAPLNHMAVGVKVDALGSYWIHDYEIYFYLETTSGGWEIGEYPEDLEKEAHIFELKPIPMCVLNWTAQWKARSQIEVNITVSNVGTAMAIDIYVYASFDAGEGNIWNQKTSDSFNLDFGESETKPLVLQVPRKKRTRLIVGIVDSEGYSIDESYSNWFDT
jgi:hypothetical protein